MDSPGRDDGSGKESLSELSAELSKDERMIRGLQSKLSSLNSAKSAQIRQLREINVQLGQLVPKITELKAARDKETAAVRELKVKRQQANDAVKAISPEVKKALDAKEAAVGSLSKIKGPGRKSASQLYSEMEAIEMRIITEAMPFSREKELMKVVHEKKKQLEGIKAFSEAVKSHRELFSKFSDLRRQSFSSHSELQKHAGESQKFHEQMIAAVEKVKALRVQKKALLDQLGKVKCEFAEADSSLRGTLHELFGIKQKLDSAAAAKRQAEAERRKAEVEQKENQLTEKLKSGKKLTARDLIALQGKP